MIKLVDDLLIGAQVPWGQANWKLSAKFEVSTISRAPESLLFYVYNVTQSP